MDKEPFNEVSSSLEETLINSDLTSVTIELAEVSLDQLLNDGLLKDIPILSTLVGVGKTAQNVRNHLFLKKMIYFISQVSTIPQKEREEVINEIDQSQKFRIKVGEKLLYIIDRSEDYKSAEVIAKLFSAFLKRKITYPQFLKTSAIVNGVFFDDLKSFVNQEKRYTNYSLEEIGDLINSGLYDIEVEQISIDVEDQDDHKSNRKYKTYVDGGTLRANISSIGILMQDILKNQLD